jgi:hypothetical protein
MEPDALSVERKAPSTELGYPYGVMVLTDGEVEGYARECVRLANLTIDPQIREHLFQMAREWMEVAMHEETTPELKSPFAQPARACCGPQRRKWNH